MTIAKTKTNLNEINIIDIQFGYSPEQMEKLNLYGTGTDNYSEESELLQVPESTEVEADDFDWGELFE